MIKRALYFLVLLLLACSAVRTADAASVYEETMEKAMRSALVATGMQPSQALKMSQQYVFLGTVMLRDIPAKSLEEQQRLLVSQAEKVGAALGESLGYTHKVYGEKRMIETATVMMHAVRAGVQPKTASETFAVMAENGYAFNVVTSVFHQTSEAVRTMGLADAGSDLCGKIRKLALKKSPLGDLQKEIQYAVRREENKQKALLAKNEKGRGGESDSNERASRSAGEGASRGATSASGASSSSSSKGSSGSEAGSSASGSGSSSSSSSGAGSSSGSGSASGSSGAGSGSSGAGGSSSAGSGSGAAGSTSGGTSTESSGGTEAGKDTGPSTGDSNKDTGSSGAAPAK